MVVAPLFCFTASCKGQGTYMTEARVLALVGNITGCTLWRIWQPMAELQRRQYPAQWAHTRDPLLQHVAGSYMFDAMIFPRLKWPRNLWGFARNMVNALHNNGIAAIYEADDDMFSDSYGRFLMDVRDHTPEEADQNREEIRFALSLMDGVTVSSRRLATIVRQHTDKPVMVVENAIDWHWFRAVQAATPRKINGLTIGWAGGKRDDADLEPMAVAWGRIARRYPQVTFVVQGHQAPAIYENVPHDRIKAIEWLPLEAYPAGLKNIDIGCAPLDDTPFNRAKTYIKVLEYAAAGAPVVASPVVYGQIIRHGRNGLLATTADEWEAALARLVESERLRQRLSGVLASDVQKKYSLEASVIKWPLAWTTIVDEFRKTARSRLFIPALGGARVQV